MLPVRPRRTTDPPGVGGVDGSGTRDARPVVEEGAERPNSESPVLPLSPQGSSRLRFPRPKKKNHGNSPRLLPIDPESPGFWPEDLVAVDDDSQSLLDPAGGNSDLFQNRVVEAIKSLLSSRESSANDSLASMIERDHSAASDVSRLGSLPPSLISGMSTPTAADSRESVSRADGCSVRSSSSRREEVEGESSNGAADHQTNGGVVQHTGTNGGEAEEVDDGYETDEARSISESLTSSTWDYPFENGRRYHRYQEGRYNFPNEEREQDREDMKHEMMRRLCNNRLHLAPIGPVPQEMLDIGTGTGIWAIQMGDLYPTANILGIDLSPIQPPWAPPNVRFMVDDVEQPWLHQRNHFDYIHARHIIMAIRDWPKLFGRSLEHLRPGGWIEVQEILHYPFVNGSAVDPEHPIAQYWDMIRRALAALGVDFHAVSERRLQNMMRDAGFVNVQERVFTVPIGPWAKNSDLKTIGRYWLRILEDGLQAIAMAPLTRGLQWTREEVEVFLIQVRRAYANNSALMYMPLHIIFGQKPQSS